MNESTVIQLGKGEFKPVVSIIVLNCNGAGWLPKCFASLKAQTIVNQMEVIMVDNCSTDNSIALASELLADFPRSSIVKNTENLGYCEGNNSGARPARGEFLLFLNNDTWLEPDCMEILVAETKKAGAAASTPWVLNYGDDTHQDLGFFGFDIFGLPSPSAPAEGTREIFIAGGCSCMVDAEVFKRVGMFDPQFFIYSDEVDLCWRICIAGEKVVGVTAARLHHRGAAGVNPAGGAQVLEFRSNDRKRFLTNRNNILTLLKDGQFLIALLAMPLTCLIFLETLVGCAMLKRWSFFRATFWDMLKDCWRLRGYIGEQRKFVRSFRRRSDFGMLRYFRLPLNRWFEIKRLFQFGLPRVDSK